MDEVYQSQKEIIPFLVKLGLDYNRAEGLRAFIVRREREAYDHGLAYAKDLFCNYYTEEFSKQMRDYVEACFNQEIENHERRKKPR